MTSAPHWLTLQILLLGLAVVLASCLALATLIISTKSVNARRARRHEKHLLPHRPQLLELAAGEGGETALRALDDIPSASWPTVQDFVLTLLGKVKGEPARDLVQVLVRHDAHEGARRDATSRRAVRRGQAATVLGRCGDPADLPLLVGLLKDRNPLVRQAAAVAVGQLREPAAAPALLTAIRGHHQSPGIPAGVAVDSLIALRFGIEDALSQGVRDADPGVRAAAAEAVAGRNAVLARPAVREALTVEQDPTVAAALCRALGAVGDDADVPVLQRAATEGPAAGRRAAIEALGAIRSAESVRVLAQLLAGDPALSAVAAHTLAAMDHPRAQAALRDAEAQGSRTAHEQLAVLRLRRGLRVVDGERTPEVRGA